MFSLEECIGAVSDGLRESTGRPLLFFYCQQLQIGEILANTNPEIVELLVLVAHRKPESLWCSQLDVWYDRA